MRFDPREDGITHINIYSKAQTQLGRYLSNFTFMPCYTSIGHFNSIEGLIYFMGSFDDRLRTVSGIEAKQLGEELDRNVRLPEDIFKKIVIEGMKSKIGLHGPFKKILEASELPLTHYYVYGNKVVDIPKWQWQIEAWEQIRQELKNGQVR